MKHTALSMLKQKGFTLIELLIVIALLGALAVGLLATIDPFEQLKKGTDTSQRNTVSEFYNASIRYYASKNEFPWATAVPQGQAISGTTWEGYISSLISAGELKNRFMDLAGRGNLAKIFVTSSGSDLAVCYKPDSRSFQLDQNAIYDSVGGTSYITMCKSQTSDPNSPAASSCFYCIQ